jgi:low temperature requirement protein LtrA
MYHDIHGNNDIRTRVFTFMQMFTVAGMSVFAHNAIGEGSQGFALSYAAFQLILTFLWWRTGIHDPDHRPLSGPYSFMFLLSTLMFAGSVFIAEPWRYYLWGTATVLSILLPLFILLIGRKRPAVRDQVDRTTSFSSSAVERFGLFTIIVLGEVIVGVVIGVAEHHQLSWLVGGTAALGMLIAIGVWWTYFDFVSLQMPRVDRFAAISWLYLHLVMTLGIAAIGAAVLNVIEQTGERIPSAVRWVLVGAITAALLCIALLMRTVKGSETHQRIRRVGSWVTLSSAIVAAPLAISSLNTIPLLVVLVLLMLAPVIAGFWAWIRIREGDSIQ